MARDIRIILLEQARTRRSAREEVTGKPLNLDMIEYSMNNECYIGYIDSFFKNYVIDDFTVNYWIRTSFIFINSLILTIVVY